MLLSNAKKSWKILMITMVAVLVISMLSACGKKTDSNAADNSKVVATYKGGQITENQFNKEVSMMTFLYPQYAQIVTMDQFKEYLVKQEVAYTVLADAATDNAKTDGKKKAKEQLDSLKKQAGDQFKTELDKVKLTEQDVLDYMTRLLTVVSDYNAKVTDEQVKAEFEKTKGDYTVATVRHVLIGLTTSDNKTRTKEEALKIANEVEAKLKAPNADWKAIAKQYSDDGGSKENGGEYKDVTVNSWVESFKNAALTQPLNTVGAPVESDYGYHVIEVLSRTEKTLDQLSDEQKETLRGKVASEGMDKYMSDELPKLDLKIDLPKTEQKTDQATTDNKSTTTDKSDSDKKDGDTATDTTKK